MDVSSKFINFLESYMYKTIKTGCCDSKSHGLRREILGLREFSVVLVRTRKSLQNDFYSKKNVLSLHQNVVNCMNSSIRQ